MNKKYSELLQRDEKQIAAENLNFQVETAKNQLESAILTVQRDSLEKQNELSKAQQAVKSAEKNLDDAKGQNPFSAQNLIDCYQAVKQANLNVEAAQSALSQTKDVLDFLENTKKELFD